MKPIFFIAIAVLLAAAGLMILKRGEDSRNSVGVPETPESSSEPPRPALAGQAIGGAESASRPPEAVEETQGSSLAGQSMRESQPARTLNPASPAAAPRPAPPGTSTAAPATAGAQTTASIGNAPPSAGVTAAAAGARAGGEASTVPLATDGVLYEIDPGIKAPVALAGIEEPLTPQQAAAVEQIAREFDEAVVAAGDSAEAWEEARRAADERYRLLFGDEAFNQKTMREAREALRSANP